MKYQSLPLIPKMAFGSHESRHRPITPVHNAKPKDMRILALEPLYARKRLIVHPRVDIKLLSQLFNYPRATHDDVPDAIAGACDLARTHSLSPSVKSFRIRPHVPKAY